MDKNTLENKAISSEEKNEEYLKLQKKAKNLTIVLCVVVLLDVLVGVLALTDKKECVSSQVESINDIDLDNKYYSSDNEGEVKYER